MERIGNKVFLSRDDIEKCISLGDSSHYFSKAQQFCRLFIWLDNIPMVVDDDSIEILGNLFFYKDTQRIHEGDYASGLIEIARHVCKQKVVLNELVSKDEKLYNKQEALYFHSEMPKLLSDNEVVRRDLVEHERTIVYIQGIICATEYTAMKGQTMDESTQFVLSQPLKSFLKGNTGQTKYESDLVFVNRGEIYEYLSHIDYSLIRFELSEIKKLNQSILAPEDCEKFNVAVSDAKCNNLIYEPIKDCVSDEEVSLVRKILKGVEGSGHEDSENDNYRVIERYCRHMLKNGFEIERPKAAPKFYGYMKENIMSPVKKITAKSIEFNDGTKRSRDAFLSAVNGVLRK